MQNYNTHYFSVEINWVAMIHTREQQNIIPWLLIYWQYRIVSVEGRECHDAMEDSLSFSSKWSEGFILKRLSLLHLLTRAWGDFCSTVTTWISWRFSVTTCCTKRYPAACWALIFPVCKSQFQNDTLPICLHIEKSKAMAMECHFSRERGEKKRQLLFS